MAIFADVIPHILKAEGGAIVTNVAGDRGGWTKYGVTQYTLSDYRGYTCGETEIRALTETEAAMIYKKKFWDRARLDEVTSTMKAHCIMDQAVNRGVVNVIKQVQTLCRVFGKYVTVDGVMGDSTVAAVNSLPDAKFAREFLQNSRHYYVNLVINNATQIKFLKGWINRVDNVEDLCWK